MAPKQKTNAIAALFDDRASANEAIERLVSVGISPTKIEVLTGADAIAFATSEENGFWHKLATLLFEDDDRSALLRDLRHGSHLLVLSDLELDEDDLALDILDNDDLWDARNSRFEK
ncbi:hypothetical protein HGP16_21285 [Rhizobium sp. P40RR-XXII]|uniref:hypothetical protein n=1 Tax=Rhizobium sp. P40RR-XXII TaxID=2726739 RepID=UPI0014572C0D|nr:hypothetical protein [Rhizobium sp. P40RR-XXII]NLS19075.1 hypothetical protein [Rhizobium sp. P40RR-XXII]